MNIKEQKILRILEWRAKLGFMIVNFNVLGFMGKTKWREIRVRANPGFARGSVGGKFGVVGELDNGRKWRWLVDDFGDDGVGFWRKLGNWKTSLRKMGLKCPVYELQIREGT
ncbi:unnamed protein product [Dovyalis caffra]|uniref:Uncharacterized protein n=1 Tax=Dovyalis caffra TaxID=77055 RepID=A0AAV1RZZ4_9ROSI|nr:unnamed protein product [Dovyalis caffra]